MQVESKLIQPCFVMNNVAALYDKSNQKQNLAGSIFPLQMSHSDHTTALFSG